ALERAVNVAFSGGEKKRNETVQLAVLRPKMAVIDEIDSGLDIDALRTIARRIEAMTTEDGLGVLAITHYARLLTELRPDRVHVPEPGHGLYNPYIDELILAEELGFDGVCVNEHHQNAYGNMPSPNLIASILARQTSRVRIAVVGNALPLYDPPTRVAE